MHTNIKLHLSYDGTGYHGFQIQPSALTLQESIEKALSCLFNIDIRINAAGRTDAGVHARGQIINFYAPNIIPLNRLPRVLNGYLPKDITAYHAEEADHNFHACYSARRKIYIYTIDNGDYPDVFKRYYAWHIPQPIKEDLLKQSAVHLVGYHNFSCFQAAGSDIIDAHRNLYRLQITKEGQFIKLLIEADGFLYKMARNIIGTMVDVGLNKRKPSEIPRIIKMGDRSLAGPTAPAHGLCLWKVIY